MISSPLLSACGLSISPGRSRTIGTPTVYVLSIIASYLFSSYFGGANDPSLLQWLRAEILGAFFNATFLIGLCVTIVLEAIQRFFDPPDIRNPEVVLIVGCFGLGSNLLGFWVLGGHGHSHGPGDVEAGHDHSHAHDHDHPHITYTRVDGVVDDIEEIDSCPDEDEEAVTEEARPQSPETTRHIAFAGLDSSRAVERSTSRGSARSRGTAGMRVRANSGRRVLTTIDDISIHPASFRNDIREIIAASQSRSVDEEDVDSEGTTNVDDSAAPPAGDGMEAAAAAATERTPLIGGAGSNKYKTSSAGSPGKNGAASALDEDHNHSHDHDHNHDHDYNHDHAHAHTQRSRRDSHGGHHHNEPREPGAVGGHSHGDMGMNAMVLHVIGDALGNIGVIVTALVIWKTTWAYRMYADPLVSLFITLIILKSAIPLTKATSKILLQATPDHININDIREDIEDLEGVRSCHHIHVWQLSDSQIVASLHIEVAFPISEHGGERYMELARRVRKCLHGYGIHSATIQPEFRIIPGSSTSDSGDDHDHDHDLDHNHGHIQGGHDHSAHSHGGGHGDHGPSAAAVGALGGAPAPFDGGDGGPSCLLDCVDDCVGKGCCSVGSRTASRTGSPPGSSRNSDHGGHSHAH